MAPSCCRRQGGGVGLTVRTWPPQVSGCAPVPSVGEQSEERGALLGLTGRVPLLPHPSHLYTGVNRMQSHLEVCILD